MITVNCRLTRSSDRSILSILLGVGRREHAHEEHRSEDEGADVEHGHPRRSGGRGPPALVSRVPSHVVCRLGCVCVWDVLLQAEWLLNGDVFHPAVPMVGVW